ncbi:hypothetical protein STENM36S_00227 [Streptomyces tendae]
MTAVQAARERGDAELTARVISACDVSANWTRSDDPELARSLVAAAERTLAALPESPTTDAAHCRLLATVALESRGVRSPRGPRAAAEAGDRPPPGRPRAARVRPQRRLHAVLHPRRAGSPPRRDRRRTRRPRHPARPGQLRGARPPDPAPGPLRPSPTSPPPTHTRAPSTASPNGTNDPSWPSSPPGTWPCAGRPPPTAPPTPTTAPRPPTGRPPGDSTARGCRAWNAGCCPSPCSACAWPTAGPRRWTRARTGGRTRPWAEPFALLAEGRRPRPGGAARCRRPCTTARRPRTTWCGPICGWWCRWPSATPTAVCPSSTLSRRATSD